MNNHPTTSKARLLLHVAVIALSVESGAMVRPMIEDFALTPPAISQPASIVPPDGSQSECSAIRVSGRFEARLGGTFSRFISGTRV